MTFYSHSQQDLITVLAACVFTKKEEMKNTKNIQIINSFKSKQVTKEHAVPVRDFVT